MQPEGLFQRAEDSLPHGSPLLQTHVLRSPPASVWDLGTSCPETVESGGLRLSPCQGPGEPLRRVWEHGATSEEGRRLPQQCRVVPVLGEDRVLPWGPLARCLREASPLPSLVFFTARFIRVVRSGPHAWRAFLTVTTGYSFPVNRACFLRA